MTTVQDIKLYTTKEAAEYLGIAVATVKYHLYQAEDLKADAKVGGRLVFTQETLDHFAEEIKRRPGRPGKNEDVEQFPSAEEESEEDTPDS